MANGSPSSARVVRVEGRLDGVEHRVGQRVALAVEAEQAGHVDDLVVHLAPLGVPRHALDQPGEQVVGAVQPARQDVDPRAVRQQGAPHPTGQRRHLLGRPARPRGRAGSPARSAPHPSCDRTPVRTVDGSYAWGPVRRSVPPPSPPPSSPCVVAGSAGCSSGRAARDRRRRPGQRRAPAPRRPGARTPRRPHRGARSRGREPAADAVTRDVGDVDGDGQDDEAWLAPAVGGAVTVGIRTAAGGASAVAVSLGLAGRPLAARRGRGRRRPLRAVRLRRAHRRPLRLRRLHGDAGAEPGGRRRTSSTSASAATARASAASPSTASATWSA